MEFRGGTRTGVHGLGGQSGDLCNVCEKTTKSAAAEGRTLMCYWMD